MLSTRAYRRVTLITLFALGFIIVTGGAVRLTGSGLGCPRWPTCTASSVVAPSQFHPVVEFGNRVVTGIVSLAVIVCLLLAPRRLRLLASGLVVGLIAQIVLGGLTVRHRLDPGYVMAHFLLSMLIVWDAVVLYQRLDPPRVVVDRTVRAMGVLAALMAACTVVLGTVVTGAGPHSGATARDGVVHRWHLDLHRITQLHGISAMLLSVYALVLLLVVSGPALDRLRQLVAALGFQVLIGYTQYFTGVPASLVALHVLGAVLVWVTALRFALMAGCAVSSPDLVPA